jgi:hypothetical protein
MASNDTVIDVHPSADDAPQKGEEQSASDNDRTMKFITSAFLSFRDVLTSVIPRDRGTIDDLTMIWSARFAARTGKDQSPPAKTGHLTMHMCTRNPPDEATGKHGVTDSIDVVINMPFERDMHPVTYRLMVEEAAKKKKEESEAMAAAGGLAKVELLEVEDGVQRIGDGGDKNRMQNAE